MKQLSNISFCLILGSLLLGCNDLLNKPEPSDQLSYDIALNDPSIVSGIRLKMYNRLQSFSFTTLYMLGPDALADGFTQRRGNGRFEEYIQNQLRGGLSDDGAYEQVYELVNNANTLIHSIPEGVLSTTEEERFIGEAYFFRAFGFHQLAKILGYEPDMTPSVGKGKDFDYSIILRTEPTSSSVDALNFKTRSTSKEVYDQIELDLKESIKLLSNNTDAQSATSNFVKASAAEALLARVNLYRRDYKEANKYAQDALVNSSARLATPAEVISMFNETVGDNPEAIFLLNVNPTVGNESRTTESVSGYTSTYWNALVPSQQAYDLYSNNDVRKTAWFDPCNSIQAGNCVASAAPTGLELIKWNGDKGHQTDDIPFFRVSELLLIQTEARLFDSALGDPLIPINLLRSNRGVAPLVAVTIQEILDERQREFIGEGHRFFDLKRLGRDIKKASGIPIPFTSLRVLDNIPDSEMQTNPKLVQNPGY